MKIVLVNPPSALEELLGLGKEFVQSYEPLGILYIAAVLRERGHDAVVIDAEAEALGADELFSRIAALAPQMVGFSVLTCSGELCYHLGRRLCAELPETFVVFGNVHASVYSREYLGARACHAVIHGEGEYVFCDLADHLSGGRALDDIAAISFLDPESGYRRTSAEPAVVKDLDSLPMPARDLVDSGLYRLTGISNQMYVPRRGEIARTMVTSRGCPNRCTFCVVHGSRKPRYNSPSRVVDEMEMLEKDCGNSYVYIMDPLFIGDRERVFAICDEYRRRKLTIRWGFDAHVRFVTPELLRAMRGAGLYDISFGIESGVDRLLKVIKKGITTQQARAAVMMVREHIPDVKIGGLFILGIPGGTESDCIETIRFAKSLPLDMAQFSIFAPYPGSRVFCDFEESGAIDSGRRENDGVDPTVWKRYSSYVAFTGNSPAWVPDGFSAEQLVRLQKRAQREFYLRPGQVLKHLGRLRPGNICTVVKIALKGFF